MRTVPRKQAALAWGASLSPRASARTPIDYFKRLLEEACPNHAYPVRRTLKECSMMWSFMTSGSFTWGAEPNEGPNGSDTTPFPKENAIIMVFRGCPLVGRHRMSSLGPGIQLAVVGAVGAKGVTAQVLHSTQVKI
jgi:hypothetical protein